MRLQNVSASLAVASVLAFASWPALAQQPLKTAVDGTFAPHAMPKLSGGIEGFNVDLANEIGKRLKRPVEIAATQFSGILPSLQAGTLDFVAAPVTVTKELTTIIDGGGAAADVAGRVAQIKQEIENSDSDWDKEKLQERLAKLAGGVGVIKVGAHTEVELKERKHRLEDAISATKAAVEEGIVAGGGAALIHASAGLADGLGCSGDEKTGVMIVRDALFEPARWIAENAGMEGRVGLDDVVHQAGDVAFLKERF